jgi:hypothetical protein
MRRRLVLFAYLLGIPLILVLIGFFLITRFYNAAGQVSARVERMLGGRVTLEHAQVGLTEATGRDLKLYETDEAASRPWLTARRLSADASLWELLRGATPQRLTLEDVSVYLRFDKSGRLLTRLPAAQGGEPSMPEIVVENATITIDQEGRSEFTVHGAAIKIAQEEGQYAVTGVAQDPEWGNWDLKASAPRDLAAADATIETQQPIPFKQAMLERLPFIPAEAWKELQCDGTSAARITLNITRDAHFHVQLEPKLTRLVLPPLDLEASHAKGKVTVDDAVVRFVDMETRIAGGTSVTNATLDFTKEPYQFKIDLRVSNLDVTKLPKSWELPPEVGGKLTGHAELIAFYQDGKWDPSGKGEGVIANATVAGIPAEPITLKLHPAGKRFRFRTEAPRGPKSELPPSPAGAPTVRTVSWQEQAPPAALEPAVFPEEAHGPRPARVFRLFSCPRASSTASCAAQCEPSTWGWIRLRRPSAASLPPTDIRPAPNQATSMST